METAKIFTTGGSQAIRLPKRFRLNGSEVYVNKIGNVLVVVPKTQLRKSFRRALSLFTDDFMAEGRSLKNKP